MAVSDEGTSDAAATTDGDADDDKEVDSENSVYVIRLRPCPFWSLTIIAAVLIIFPIGLLTYKLLPHRVEFDQGIVQHIGVDGLVTFRQYDRDDDGCLSLEEYEPLAHLLNDVNLTEPYEYDDTIEPDDEVFTLWTYFTPLNLSTMTKDVNDSFMRGHTDPLHYLKAWLKPHREWQNLGVRHLSVFLPPAGFGVGEPYMIVPSMLPGNGATLSNNRYYSTMVHGSEVTIHRLLSAFHPNPFIYSRFAPQGSVAVVGAVSEDYYHIYFRIHAEYQLNKPPFYPFWFTPGQFTGDLIVTRNFSHLVHFNLRVPADIRLNVDMEWLTGNGPESMEVDIGHLPRMSLTTVPGGCRPATSPHEDVSAPGGGHVHDYRRVPQSQDEGEPSPAAGIQWAPGYMTGDRARGVMERKMYPFKEVPYHGLPTALELARTEGKLVHAIILWGALDDQSC